MLTSDATEKETANPLGQLSATFCVREEDFSRISRTGTGRLRCYTGSSRNQFKLTLLDPPVSDLFSALSALLSKSLTRKLKFWI